jgi:hypothetical protein
MQLLPGNTTIGDMLTASLQECGAVGVGETPLGEDITKAWARCQWMLQEWERKRWLVYHLVTYSKISTGQTSYTFGPGGEINTNYVAAWTLESLSVLSGGTGYAVNDTINLVATPPSGTPAPAGVAKVLGVSGGVITSISVSIPGLYPAPLPVSFSQGTTSGGGAGATFQTPVWGLSATGVTNPVGSARPAKVESAFLRQLNTVGPNQVDYPMRIIQSMEDYNRIALKGLMSFPGGVFLDSQWPLANLFFYPVPQANIYGIYVSVMEQLPTNFLTTSTALNLPYEYYSCILYNLALRLRPVYQIGTYPGDPLPGLAKNALNVLRGANTQIASLVMPTELTRPGIYNIFSDRDY